MKKFLSILLAMLMMVTAFATVAISASAADAAAPVARPAASKYTGTPDYSWYVDIAATKAATDGKIVKKAAADKVYTISTADQFMAFNLISNGLAVIEGKAYTDYENFKDETIKLAADIVLNEGDAADWYAAAEEGKQVEGLYVWENPISMSWKVNDDKKGGTNVKANCHFDGTFDGQGHVISGIYGYRIRSQALFGEADGATITNFAIVNSIFYASGTVGSTENQGATQGVGLIERLAGGTLSKVYTDAYFKGGWCTGALVAYLQGVNTVVEDCVFAGVTNVSYGNGGFNGGAVIGGDDGSGRKNHVVRNVASFGTLIAGVSFMPTDTTRNMENKATNKVSGFMGSSDCTTFENVISATKIIVKDGRNLDGLSAFVWSNNTKTNNDTKANAAKDVFVDVTKATTTVLNGNTAVDMSADIDATTEAVEPSWVNVVGKKTSEMKAVIDNAETTDATDTIWAGWTKTDDGYVPTAIKDLVAAAKTISAKAAEDAAAAKAAAAEKLAADAAAAEAAAKKAAEDAAAELAAAKAAAEKAAADLEAAKAELAEAKKADDAATDEKGGCGAMIATGAILVTVSALGLGYVATKKRED